MKSHMASLCVALALLTCSGFTGAGGNDINLQNELKPIELKPDLTPALQLTKSPEIIVWYFASYGVKGDTYGPFASRTKCEKARELVRASSRCHTG